MPSAIRRSSVSAAISARLKAPTSTPSVVNRSWHACIAARKGRRESTPPQVAAPPVDVASGQPRAGFEWPTPRGSMMMTSWFVCCARPAAPLYFDAGAKSVSQSGQNIGSKAARRFECSIRTTKTLIVRPSGLLRSSRIFRQPQDISFSIPRVTSVGQGTALKVAGRPDPSCRPFRWLLWLAHGARKAPTRSTA